MILKLSHVQEISLKSFWLKPLTFSRETQRSVHLFFGTSVQWSVCFQEEKTYVDRLLGHMCCLPLEWLEFSLIMSHERDAEGNQPLLRCTTCEKGKGKPFAFLLCEDCLFCVSFVHLHLFFGSHFWFIPWTSDLCFLSVMPFDDNDALRIHCHHRE